MSTNGNQKSNIVTGGFHSDESSSDGDLDSTVLQTWTPDSDSTVLQTDCKTVEIKTYKERLNIHTRTPDSESDCGVRLVRLWRLRRSLYDCEVGLHSLTLHSLTSRTPQSYKERRNTWRIGIYGNRGMGAHNTMIIST